MRGLTCSRFSPWPRGFGFVEPHELILGSGLPRGTGLRALGCLSLGLGAQVVFHHPFDLFEKPKQSTGFAFGEESGDFSGFEPGVERKRPAIIEAPELKPGFHIQVAVSEGGRALDSFLGDGFEATLSPALGGLRELEDFGGELDAALPRDEGVESRGFHKTFIHRTKRSACKRTTVRLIPLGEHSVSLWGFPTPLHYP